MKTIRINNDLFDYQNVIFRGPIDIILRRLVPNTDIIATNLKYIVEIVGESDTLELATLEVPLNTAHSKICLHVFKDKAFGRRHTLKFRDYKVGDEVGSVLVVNGFLWDDGIIQEMDIAI